MHQVGIGLMTLHEMIEKTGAKSVIKHAPWPGRVPSTLTPPSDIGFTFTSNVQFWQAAVAADSLGIAWVLKLNDKKCLTPTGVTLYNVKHMIIPASGSAALL